MVIKSLMQIFANTQLEINRKGSDYQRVRGSDIKIEINTFFYINSKTSGNLQDLSHR